MVCAGCKNLDAKKKYKGKDSGCKYYCKKNKCYVRGSDDICKKFSKSLTRDNNEYNKLYHEGLDFADDSHSITFYIVGTILLLIILILVKLFN